LAAARVMSKGRTWSEYQGRATSLKPCTSDRGIWSSWSTVALTGRAISRVRVELKTLVWAGAGLALTRTRMADIYLYII
jgi:hypothetical protein